MTALSSALEAALDDEVVRLTPLSGGDVAESFRVELARRGTVFAKTRLGASPSFFQTEATGLSWLRASGAIAVPEVLACGQTVPFLALEWIKPGRPTSTSESDFGSALARMHQAGAPSFGRTDRMPTGSRNLPNQPYGSWAESYAANRLLPLARIATDDRALAPDTIRRIELLASQLGSLGVPDEAPARLHGDLWAGNRMIGAGGVSWLIDPAARGGHREYDLSMMLLFGGFGADCFVAYDEVAPLADGWQDRVPLHQLAPLIVHAIKFGGGYVHGVSQALAAAEALVGGN